MGLHHTSPLGTLIYELVQLPPQLASLPNQRCSPYSRESIQSHNSKRLSVEPMPHWILALRAAFTFLTRIPVGGFPYPPQVWPLISIWFPIVGLLLGGVQAALWFALSDLSDPTRCIVVMSIGLLLTGAFHEDGLSDAVDGLGGGYDAPTVLRIIKDSRIGAFGSIALIMALGLKLSLLVDLGPQAYWGFLLGQSLSRVGPVLQMALLPYVHRDDPAAKSRDVASSGKAQGLAVSLQFVLICWFSSFFGLSGGCSLALALSVAAISLSFGLYVRRRVGGIAGDFLGATQQLSELGILFVLVLL